MTFINIVLSDENEFASSVPVSLLSLVFTPLLLSTFLPLHLLVVNRCRQFLLLTRRMIRFSIN